MMPAACKSGWSPAGGNGSWRVEAARKDDRLELAVLGAVDAMELVEKLSRLLKAESRAASLSLDLSAAAAFDHLSLSALLVVLRNHADKFAEVRVLGLSAWARLRVVETGAENIMGRQWGLAVRGAGLEFRPVTC